jgi:hypothetical protein
MRGNFGATSGDPQSLVDMLPPPAPVSPAPSPAAMFQGDLGGPTPANSHEDRQQG